MKNYLATPQAAASNFAAEHATLYAISIVKHMVAALAAFLPAEPHDALLYAANFVTAQSLPYFSTPSLVHSMTFETEKLSTL